MSHLDDHLNRTLDALRSQHLFRTLREIAGPQTVSILHQGRSLTAFASNDYLGLANHPRVKNAAIEAVQQFGAGAGASRLITGSLPPHQRLEQRLAQFKGTEAAITFANGYQTAMGTLSALLSPDDTVFSDRLNHACLIDGIRLSKAQVQIFEHNDMDHLKSLLTQARANGGSPRTDKGKFWIVTESVFSMDGDRAPLRTLVELKHEFAAHLMVDEAHATGLLGPERRGLASETGLAEEIDVQMGTLGKALGSAGGFICGSQTLREFLINRARPFIFSTAPVPAAAAAAEAALDIVESAEGKSLVASLWDRVVQLHNGLQLTEAPSSPIIPYLIGCEKNCLSLSEQLLSRGFLVPGIRYPTVPMNQARLRITLSAAHTEPQVTQLLDAIHDIENASTQA